MAGLPGTGKSAVAVPLARRLDAIVLDKDVVRSALFAPEHVEYSTQQDDFCVSVMLEVARYLLARGRSQHVILDGRPHVRRYQVELVDDYARVHGLRVRLIECVCSEETALARLAADARTGAHSALNRDGELYFRLKSMFEPIRQPKLVVQTDAPLEEVVARCEAYVAAPD
jgi:adenylylsulfate kinase